MISFSLLQRDSRNNLVQKLSEPYRSGSFTSGPLKVLQEFIAELCTVKGSVRFERSYGCGLVSVLGRTNASSISSFYTALQNAVNTVTSNMTRRRKSTTPLNESLDHVDIDDVQQELTAIKVQLTCYTADGSDESATISFPF